MRSDRKLTDVQDFTILKAFDMLDSCDGRKNSILRIVLPYSSLTQDQGACWTRYDARVAPALKLRNPACMIEMNV